MISADPTMLLAIALMALTTYIPRFLPLLVLSRRALHPLVESWLSYVPAAVLAALLGPALFLPEGQVRFSLADNPHFWAAIPCFVVALITRNMFYTVLTGMGSISLLRLIF